MNSNENEPDIADSDIYELDDDEASSDLDDVAREAVEAVEAVRESRREEGPDVLDLEALHQELQETRDRAARTLADFENYRKRNAREREEMLRYASSGVLVEFLDVMDNLERALSAGGSVEDLKLGVEMIHRQMQDLLRRAGVAAVPAVGEIFDPSHHEAVSRRESGEVEAPEVVEELQKGYTLHERLLRPARVIVAVPKAPSAGEGSPEG